MRFGLLPLLLLSTVATAAAPLFVCVCVLNQTAVAPVSFSFFFWYCVCRIEQRELVSKLLSDAYPDILSSREVCKGFERLFEMIDDIQLDAPKYVV